MLQGRTTPPSPLTEPDLIGLMDENGIGTDATIAEHIKKIQERDYASKQQDFFYPTPVGRMLLGGYTRMGFDLGRPELRAEMERDMGRVATGQITKAQAIDKSVKMMKQLFVRGKSAHAAGARRA